MNGKHPLSDSQKPPIYRLRADEATTLSELLRTIKPPLSNQRIKQFLAKRCVTINGKVVTRYDSPIVPGNLIEVFARGLPDSFRHPLAEELWRDEHFILVEKRAGLPTIAKGGMKGDTLYRLVAAHEKATDPRAKIFLLNRLDGATRGLILFARSREVQQTILADWTRYIPEQTFIAVVEGILFPRKGQITKPKEGNERAATTEYSVLGYGAWCTLMELRLLGRHNAIRTTLKASGHAILGDQHEHVILTYSKGLAFYQKQLTLIHPETGKEMRFTSAQNENFDALLRKIPTRKQRAAIALLEEQKAENNRKE